MPLPPAYFFPDPRGTVMTKPLRLASLLLISTALVAPAAAMAQSEPTAETPAPPVADPATDPATAPAED